MYKQIVDYNTALKLKEFGYDDENCALYYNPKQQLKFALHYLPPEYVRAPEVGTLLSWFYTKKNLYFYCEKAEDGYSGDIIHVDTGEIESIPIKATSPADALIKTIEYYVLNNKNN